MQAITVSVNYDDLLAVTLPLNRPLFERYLVVTSTKDDATVDVAKQHNCAVFRTDLFYDKGCAFNKGAAIEAAFDVLGRSGWITLLDADIVLPDNTEFSTLNRECLTAARRHLCRQIPEFTGVTDNRQRPTLFAHWPLATENPVLAGFCQMFYAGSQVLQNKRPWMPVNWKHAGGSDTFFAYHWPRNHHQLVPWQVLHLGPDNLNWFGRISPKLDGTELPEAGERRKLLQQMHADRSRYGFTKEYF